jgi:hypothetical protein
MRGWRSLVFRVAAEFEMQLLQRVILRDFSPEEPALSEVEGILRAGARWLAFFVSAPRQTLCKLSMTPPERNGHKFSHRWFAVSDCFPAILVG